MRRFMMTFGSALVVLGSSLVASGQGQCAKQAPAQAPEKQAPAPVQAPEKQAPMQAPTQKLAPVQKPVQAPTQKHSVAQHQSPVQKGERRPDKDGPRGCVRPVPLGGQIDCPGSRHRQFGPRGMKNCSEGIFIDTCVLYGRFVSAAQRILAFLGEGPLQSSKALRYH